MKAIVLGTSDFTLSCAKALIDSGVTVCALVSLPKKALPLNSCDISAFSKKHNIAYYEFEDINSASCINTMRGLSPDYIISSWPKIIKQAVLKIPKYYCVGSHLTALPLNRGRHPLHWLIALGITKTKLSFFITDEGVDTGRILLQVPIKIYRKDKIADLVSRVNAAAYRSMKKLIKVFLKNSSYKGVVQDHSLANYWRKRTPYDVTLDFRMSTSMILRTTNSFSLPYACVNLIYEKHVVKITNASVVKTKITQSSLNYMEHGKIISAGAKKIRIKADDGIVELVSKERIPDVLRKAKYIYPPSKYIHKWPEELRIQLE